MIPHSQLSSSKCDRLLVGEVGDIRKYISTCGVLESRLQSLLALPLESCHDQVFRARAIERVREFGDLPAVQAVLLPGGFNEGHVSLHVVILVEMDIGWIGVHNNGGESHIGGLKEIEIRR